MWQASAFRYAFSFHRNGGRIDVQVASMGDASSLQGGQLLQSLLVGPDGTPYVTAQDNQSGI